MRKKRQVSYTGCQIKCIHSALKQVEHNASALKYGHHHFLTKSEVWKGVLLPKVTTGSNLTAAKSNERCLSQMIEVHVSSGHIDITYP